MHWTNIRLRNFRLFEDTGNLKLAPLTFFIGPNGGGKSTILKALLLLKQSVESDDPKAPITPNGRYCELGRYEDYIYRADTERKLGLRADWDAVLFQEPGKSAFEVEWALNRKTDRTRVERMAHYRDLKLGVEAEMTAKGWYRFASDQFKIGKGDGVIRELRKWYAVSGEIDPDQLGDNWPSIRVHLSELGRALERQLQGTSYLSSLRAVPKAAYPVPQYDPTDVGVWGERTGDIIYRNEDLLDKTGQWIARLKLGQGIAIKDLGKTHYSILIDDISGHRGNLINVGFGVPQSLPILVQGLVLEPETTWLVEQPEIHLNPAIQSRLADFFVHLIKDRRQQLIIETHSEHILDRVRTWMARGKLTPEQVAVYYCHPAKSGGKIKRLKLTELGTFQNWPRGFFAEGITETLAQTHSVFKRKAKEAKAS